jgi:hypothetical protein
MHQQNRLSLPALQVMQRTPVMYEPRHVVFPLETESSADTYL